MLKESTPQCVTFDAPRHSDHRPTVSPLAHCVPLGPDRGLVFERRYPVVAGYDVVGAGMTIHDLAVLFSAKSSKNFGIYQKMSAIYPICISPGFPFFQGKTTGFYPFFQGVFAEICPFFQERDSF